MRGDVGIEVHAVTVCRVDRSIATIGVTEDDLVTGEAVALDLPPATLGLRIFSRIIDLFVVQLAGGIVMTLAGVLTAIADEAVATGIMLAATVLVVVGYPVAMETLTRGRTVGKFATGLRVVRDDAGPITFRHALTRGMVGVLEISILLGIPAVISAILNDRGKRLGDVAAGTYVVRERGRGAMPPPVPMPPHLAQWAVNADIGKVPDGVAAAVRTFLPAAFSMDPAARARRGEDLLAEVLLCVAPPPPPGNHPEYILAAVVAERRRRDYDRLMREAGLRQRLGADV
ncbi:MAG: RDD family protein [Dermatophilaceae bacterium]